MIIITYLKGKATFKMAQTAMFANLNPYIELLNELCSIGTPIRKVLVECMISEALYARKVDAERLRKPAPERPEIPNDTDHPHEAHSHTHRVYTDALASLKPIKVPEVFKPIEKEIIQLTDGTMIDEFLFWCIQFEFQENLVKFLLSLLPDIRYKMMFIRSFVSKYSYISVMLLTSKSEQLSSKVVHISVQLFSNEAIALKALEECYLMPIMLSTLHNMIVTPEQGDGSSLLIGNRLENEITNQHLVVDPDHGILHENLYWLVISDMVNLLSHRNITLAFLKNKTWTKLWMELISYFQSMNLNVRQFGEHLPQDQPTYFSSFSAELEFCASIMWSLVQHLKSDEQLELTRDLLSSVMEQLKVWFEQIGMPAVLNESRVVKRPNFKHLSFHLPLNRYYSVVLYNSMYLQRASLTRFLSNVS
jgi:E3 ubiquitin-protein ligase UBR3